MYKMNCIMKYISKLLALFAIGMMATACSNDANEVNYPFDGYYSGGDFCFW